MFSLVVLYWKFSRYRSFTIQDLDGTILGGLVIFYMKTSQTSPTLHTSLIV